MGLKPLTVMRKSFATAPSLTSQHQGIVGLKDTMKPDADALLDCLTTNPKDSL